MRAKLTVYLHNIEAMSRFPNKLQKKKREKKMEFFKN